MELRIYDSQLNRLGIVELFSSMVWTRKYYEPGTFEIRAPIVAENALLFSPGNIVSKAGAVEAGVIEDVSLSEYSGKSEAVIKGRFLSSYMDRRLIQSTVNFNGRVEVAMRQLLSGATAIPLVYLGTLNSFTETVEFQATMKNLLAYESKLSLNSGIGFRFRPDFSAKRIYFETYKGTDRSYGQNVNPKVSFSEDYENLNKATYRYNDQLYKTKAIVGGEGEGSQRVYVTVGGGTGLNLREVFVDAKDIKSENLTTAEYQAALTQRGQEALDKNTVSESFDCEAAPDVNFKYKTDYDLGDIVTIQKKRWGITINQRIVELQEIYQNGGMRISLTFGTPLPQSIDWSDQ